MIITALAVLFRALKAGEVVLPTNPPLTPGLQVFRWQGKRFNALYDEESDEFTVVTE